MKRLLIILIITGCPFLLLAQTGSNETAGRSAKNAALCEPRNNEALIETGAPQNQNETDYTILRPTNLQFGVNRLPLDGTPCIVPDTDKVVPMPNAWKGPLRVPFKKKKPVALYNDTDSNPVL